MQGLRLHLSLFALTISMLVTTSADGQVTRVPVAKRSTSQSQVAGVVKRSAQRAANGKGSIRGSFFSTAIAPILKQKTVVSSRTASVSFDIDLGTPFATRSKAFVRGAPPDFVFSEMHWGKLIAADLPPGVIFALAGKSGTAEVPELDITIVIPEVATNFRPFVQQSQDAALGQLRLLPRVTSINDSISERIYNTSTYASSSTGANPSLTATAQFRTLRSITLRVPLVTVTSDGKATARQKFTAGISFDLSSPITAIVNARDPYFRDASLRLIANRGDVDRFATPFHTQLGKTKKGLSTFSLDTVKKTFDRAIVDWIDINAPYVKLLVTRTGLYRTTPQQIKSATQDMDISGWHASILRVFNHGKEIPVWVDSNADGTVSAIEFYGERLPGFTGEYYNVATDTNCYWITNSTRSSKPALRYALRSLPTQPTTQVASADIMLHHERDLFIYGGDATGDDTKTLHRTAWIDGERFIWNQIGPPNLPNYLDTSSIRDTFYIAQLPPLAAGKTATLGFFLRGISHDPANSANLPIHGYKIFLNHALITSGKFHDYDSIYATATVPLSLVNQGANFIEVQSSGVKINPSTSQSQWTSRFYFDFYQVKLEEGLVANTDTAIIAGQFAFMLSPTAPTTSLSLANIEEVHLYDLTAGVRVGRTGAQSGSFTYADSTINSPIQYVGAGLSKFLPPDRIIKWNVAGAPNWSILDTTLGADYIVLTHPLFRSTATKLQFLRRSSGMRTKLVTTDEVFSAFNYGSNEPWAIHNFLHYAYDFYAGIPPSFVTLVGDATWDPKKNLNTTLAAPADRTTHSTFVPTFGIPVSDYVFTTLEGEGVDTLTPEMVIARITVETPEEAEAFYRKLLEYENAAPAEWNKRFLFVIGGNGPLDEHSLFMDQVHAYQTSIEYGAIAFPPLNIVSNVIEKTDFQNVDVTHVAEIEEQFREGKSIVYFAGHGSPRITDVYFGEHPSDYRNIGLYPVLITLSCRTGAFAENNQVGLNEDFLRTDQAGAVMAFGTTGFGDIQFDFAMSAEIWKMLRSDTAVTDSAKKSPHSINMPTVFTLSKVITAQINYFGEFGSYNSRQQYSVLGDAAMGFALKPQPELAVKSDEIQFVNAAGIPKSIFSLSDSSLGVIAKLHNFGYSASRKVRVRFRDIAPHAATPSDVIVTLGGLDDTATVSAVFPLDTNSVGQHSISVFIDYDSAFAESNELDNIASLNVLVNGKAVSNLFPPEGSRGFCDLSADSVQLIMLAPGGSGASTASGSVELEIDTTAAFTAPTKLATIAVSNYLVEYTIPRTQLPASPSKVYWWRSKFTPSGGFAGPWESASFNIDQATPYELSYTTKDQLSSTIRSNVVLSPTASLFLPSRDTISYGVHSSGNNDTTPHIAQVVLNGKSVYTTSDAFIGIVVFSADGASVDVIDTLLIPADADIPAQTLTVVAFDSIIDRIPVGRRVAITTCKNAYINPIFSHDSTVRDHIRSLGGKDAFDKTFYFSSYALLGTKGAAPGSAKEVTAPTGSGGASITDTAIVPLRSGLAILPFTAAASRYGALKWQGANLKPGSNIVFSVLGANRIGGAVDTVLRVDAFSGTRADLSKIDARKYNRITVAMDFERDVTTLVSPELSSIEVEYTPAPELTIEPGSFSVQPTSVIEGVPVNSTYTIRNLTCVPAEQLATVIIRNYRGTIDTIGAHIIPLLVGHAKLTLFDTIQSTGRNGVVNLLADVNPNEQQNEQLTFNNTAAAAFSVGRDTTKPKIDVLVDNRHLSTCDYVSSNAQIRIDLSDNSLIRQVDSSSVSAVLRREGDEANQVFLTAAPSNNHFNVNFIQVNSGIVQVELIATPDPSFPLVPGRYTLTAVGRDASGNTADTIEVCFVVSATNGLEHVLNVPNPFKDFTSFTYQLRAGGDADVKVLVYTIAGRKIRTLTPSSAEPAHAGLNHIDWDGRDEMGNNVANGTYLYRVVMAGKNTDGSGATDAQTERAVKSR
jgi:hypothetical protein